MSWLGALLWILLAAVPVLTLALVAYPPGGGARTRDKTGGAIAALRSGLRYALLGPPLGGALAAVPGLVSGNDPAPLEMLVFIMLMAYVPGFVPAFLAGACMGVLRDRLRPFVRPPVAAGISGMAAAAFAGLFLVEPELERVAPPLLLGALAGGLLEACRLRRSWRRRAVV
ncbi:hypothetical protein [Pseudoxanthomonas sp.]|uniref:hypothetical protein n=1 Tax=Pseudoxanthomonas sp. TaxID=1871049 RepID=UPI00258F00DA|nr:hypothetical protein [Pseudoxanthomonas sp.]MCR6686649.1 hypothetical protein [Pseudoxanthomonas sp.]